jgi:hypothetical protein
MACLVRTDRGPAVKFDVDLNGKVFYRETIRNLTTGDQGFAR